MTHSNNPALGGRGKHAPYATEHYRIPSPLKSTIKNLAVAYKCLINFYKDPNDQDLIQKSIETIAWDLSDKIEALIHELRLAQEKIKSQDEQLKNADEMNFERLQLKNEHWLLTNELRIEREKQKLSLTDEQRELVDRILKESLRLKANQSEDTKEKIREIIALNAPLKA